MFNKNDKVIFCKLANEDEDKVYTRSMMLSLGKVGTITNIHKVNDEIYYDVEFKGVGSCDWWGLKEESLKAYED